MNTIDETSSLNVAPPAEADQNATLAIAKSSVSATSEHLLRLFIGRTPAAIALFDTEMRYLIASQRYIVDYRIEGIDTPDGLIGQRHYDLFPDIPARWRDVHARVLAGETLSADEDPFPRADGRVDWVHWEMLPWYQPNGSVGGAILFSEVITERVEAARALAEGEARLNLAQSAGNIGTWDWDFDPGKIVWSEQHFRQFGFDPATADGTSYQQWREAIHPEDVVETEEKLFAQIRNDSRSDIEYRIITPAGVRWIASRGMVIRNAAGDPVRMVGVSIDVTERKNAEAELRQTTALLSAIGNNSPNAEPVDRGGGAFAGLAPQ